MFGGYFEYERQFLEPVDWRPREHNTAADHLANCFLRHGADVGQLDLEVGRACLEISKGLQIFIDGRFEGEAAVGAAGITTFSIPKLAVTPQLILRCAHGVYLPMAKSAFHAKVVALDIATEFLCNLIKFMYRAYLGSNVLRPTKRVRFNV